MSEKCYSTDGSHFHIGLDALCDAPIGSVVHEAYIARPKPSSFIQSYNIENLMEALDEYVGDTTGVEEVRDFSDLPDAKVAELSALIGTWLDANVRFSWFLAENVTEHVVTEADHGDATVL